MSSRFSALRLLGTTSALALSAGAILATAMIQPAAAAGVPAGGLWAGGATLSSLTVRQILDCYNGAEVAGDHDAASASFSTNPPTPGALPTDCAVPAYGGLEGLFAAVGSGRGQQAFIANDPLQLLAGRPEFIHHGTFPAFVETPDRLPPFIDTASADTNFNTYPYPGLSFAASDTPLPASLTTNAFTFGSFPTTDWATNTHPRKVIVDGTTTVAYDVSKLGAPIQLPLYEIPVAIAVNTTGLTGLQSAAASPSAAGGAIQLSTAQVCAIFSGAVTDWASTAPIATLSGTGAVAYQLFSDDNVSTTAASTAQPYAHHHTPIRVVYDHGNSGTNFIFTNYLKANCVALDNGSGGTAVVNGATVTVAANHYAAIFGAANLPSNEFSDLKDNAAAAGNRVEHWKSARGSLGVAEKIGTDHHSAGAIGALSVNFTAPYANTTVMDDDDGAPHSASLQNEAQREAGVNHPAVGVSFIAPTPAGAHAAFDAFDSNANVPVAGTDYNKWDLYTYAYPATFATALLQGKSILGIPNTASAYPVVGTTFLEVYSCYANVSAATGNPPVVDLLSWYYNYGNSDPNTTVEAVLENNGFSGFNTLPGLRKQNLTETIYNEFLAGGANGISPAGSAATNAACKSASGA